MNQRAKSQKRGLPERLARGSVICAEGYLFELERRGYLQAGRFVPKAVLEHPEIVAQVHRDLFRAGSNVAEAFTYYGHREKLRLIGKQPVLEPLNQAALDIAQSVVDVAHAIASWPQTRQVAAPGRASPPTPASRWLVLCGPTSNTRGGRN